MTDTNTNAPEPKPISFESIGGRLISPPSEPLTATPISFEAVGGMLVQHADGTFPVPVSATDTADASEESGASRV